MDQQKLERANKLSNAKLGLEKGLRDLKEWGRLLAGNSHHEVLVTLQAEYHQDKVTLPMQFISNSISAFHALAVAELTHKLQEVEKEFAAL